MRDVKDAAHPRGTTVAVRDLFFNIPARRKFLRSEATETFHLTNLVTHYALAHPEIAFSFTSNGREVLRAAPAQNLRERAYQIFGAEFLDNLLEVNGGQPQVARITGYVSAPRDRRTSRDAQYLFVNGRFVRDRLIGRALSEGYRAILPHGVYPAALLFIETPLEEVDVNVHPGKTEVRFRRALAVVDAVREAVRGALASAGYVRADARDHSQSAINPPDYQERGTPTEVPESIDLANAMAAAADVSTGSAAGPGSFSQEPHVEPRAGFEPASQPRIEFSSLPIEAEENFAEQLDDPSLSKSELSEPPALAGGPLKSRQEQSAGADGSATVGEGVDQSAGGSSSRQEQTPGVSLPPLNSADRYTREVSVESLSNNIRPLGQLDESFIIATDNEGLLLIDQHVAHERILFDKYRALESTRLAESQQLLIPETFDLTPAQASIFDLLATELENYGFELMRLSE